MAKEKTAANDTAKGFGTGLRAQLEGRRDALEQATGAAEAAEAVVATNGSGPAADVDTVRSELAASLAREHDLRAALAEKLQSFEHDLEGDRELAERASELDVRPRGRHRRPRGRPIMGNSQPGGLTETAVRNILLLPAELRPQQVISLLGLGGPSFPLANHADHIHAGF